MRGFLGILRVHQWYKNLLCLSPWLVVSIPLSQDSAFVVLGFCFAASAVYVFNDLMDREADSLKPDRCNRPLANGALCIKTAVLLVPVLCALSWAVWPSGFSFKWVVVYLLINLVYNLGIKKHCGYGVSTAITVTGCYLVRAMPVAMVGGIELSEQALLVSIVCLAFPVVTWKQRSYLHFSKQLEEPLKLIGITGVGVLCTVVSAHHGSVGFVVWPLFLGAYLKVMSSRETREPHLALISSVMPTRLNTSGAN